MRLFMALDSDLPKSRKPERNLKDAPMPPLPFARQIIDLADKKQKTREADHPLFQKEEKFTLDEAKVLLADLEEKGKKIKSLLEEMYQSRGVTPEYLQKRLNDHNNFSPEQWTKLNKKRSELINSLQYPAQFVKLKEKWMSDLQQNMSAKTKPASPSDAKPKDRRKTGAQRRGWLPMR